MSQALRAYGGLGPAYTLPDDASDVGVLRVVVREGFSTDLARALEEDVRDVLNHLDELKPGGHFDQEQPFAHCHR